MYIETINKLEVRVTLEGEDEVDDMHSILEDFVIKDDKHDEVRHELASKLSALLHGALSRKKEK